MKGFVINVSQLAIGDFETDQFRSGNERVAGQSDQRVAIEFQFAKFGKVEERLSGYRRQHVVAEIQLNQIGESGKSRSVDVSKSATLQNNALQMSQPQPAEFIGHQLRKRIATQVQYLQI